MMNKRVEQIGSNKSTKLGQVNRFPYLFYKCLLFSVFTARETGIGPHMNRYIPMIYERIIDKNENRNQSIHP